MFLQVDSVDELQQELGEIGTTFHTLLKRMRNFDARIFPLIRSILNGESTINDPDQGVLLTAVMVDENVAEVPMREGEITHLTYKRILENGMDLTGLPIVGDLPPDEQYTFLKIVGEAMSREAMQRVYDMTQVKAKAT